jgi:hypothetical protein
MYPEKVIDRFWLKVEKTSHCWEWTGYLNPRGYGNFNCSAGRPSKTILSHRFSWIVTNGPIPIGLGVLHRCDNPKCVNPSHLFLGTQKDNSLDMVQKGRHPLNKMGYLPTGKDHHHYQKGHKITREQAYQIRAMQAPQKEIAALFGVDQSLVSMIRAGKIWKPV